MKNKKNWSRPSQSTRVFWKCINTWVQQIERFFFLKKKFWFHTNTKYLGT